MLLAALLLSSAAYAQNFADQCSPDLLARLIGKAPSAAHRALSESCMDGPLEDGALQKRVAELLTSKETAVPVKRDLLAWIYLSRSEKSAPSPLLVDAISQEIPRIPADFWGSHELALWACALDSLRPTDAKSADLAIELLSRTGELDIDFGFPKGKQAPEIDVFRTGGCLLDILLRANPDDPGNLDRVSLILDQAAGLKPVPDTRFVNRLKGSAQAELAWDWIERDPAGYERALRSAVAKGPLWAALGWIERTKPRAEPIRRGLAEVLKTDLDPATRARILSILSAL